MKDQVQLDEEGEDSGKEEDSDCEDESNDYSAGDLKKIL